MDSLRLVALFSVFVLVALFSVLQLGELRVVADNFTRPGTANESWSSAKSKDQSHVSFANAPVVTVPDEPERSSSRQDMFLLKNPDKSLTASYPPAEYRFHLKMLDKELCETYTLQCIYYRTEYPHVNLLRDPDTGKEYNPCRRFVEPCFGISESDYVKVKKFKNLKDYE